MGNSASRRPNQNFNSVLFFRKRSQSRQLRCLWRRRRPHLLRQLPGFLSFQLPRSSARGRRHSDGKITNKGDFTGLKVIFIFQGDWICLRCYHREQLRLATANANTEMNMVGVKGITKSDAGGDAASEISLEQPVPAAPAATTSGRGRKTKGKGKKQQQAAAAAAEKAEKEKRVKIYRQKYERYLRVKPETNSPFDTLIAASQVSSFAFWGKLRTKLETFPGAGKQKREQMKVLGINFMVFHCNFPNCQSMKNCQVSGYSWAGCSHPMTTLPEVPPGP